MDIEFLKSQLEDVRQQMRGKNRNNPVEAAEYVELKKDEDALIEMITAAQKEELQTQHEERVKESVDHLVNALDSVEIEGLPLRSLFAGEAQYQLVSIWFKQQIEEQAEEFSKQIQAEQLENKQLRDEVKEQEGIINGLKDEIRQLTLERDQANQYRDNAVKQLEEACKEVERLNEQVDELRVEAAVGARNAFKVVTNLDGGKELAEKIRASLPAVTVMEYIDTLRKDMRIVLAETGEEKIINYLDKGKYRLVDAQEAAEERARFLAEQANKADREDDTETSVTLGAPLDLPTFQVSQNDASGVPSVHASTAQGDSGDEREDDVPVSTEQVTRKEFEALQARVNRLEKVANLPEAV